MHDAQGIGRMRQNGKSVDEIAARLGKPKQFIYSHLKLLSLIEPIREMFISDAISNV